MFVEEPIGVARVDDPVELVLDIAGQTVEELRRSLRVVARDPADGRYREIPSQPLRADEGTRPRPCR